MKCFKLLILALAAVFAGHCSKAKDTEGIAVGFGRDSTPIEVGLVGAFVSELDGGTLWPKRKPIELSNQLLHCVVPGRSIKSLVLGSPREFRPLGLRKVGSGLA